METGLQKKPFFAIPLKIYRSSNHLDLLRSLAALEVLFCHARESFFVDYQQLEQPGILAKLFYFALGLGHESVMIFFVLSGFFISASILRARQKNSWSWKNYLIDRGSRLYVVLIPALLLGVFWDSLGIQMFGIGEDSPYGGKLLQTGQPPYYIVNNLNLGNFFGHLLFLNEIWSGNLGSNLPLWSLSYEFWYYLLFPCCLFGLFTANSRKARIACGGAAVAILFLIRTHISLYFLIWLLGTVICFTRPARQLSNRAVFAVLTLMTSSLFLGSLALSRVQPIESWGIDFLVALSFTALVYILLNDLQSQTDSGPYSFLTQGIAGFSYTLYLVHMPLLIFIRAVVIRDERWQLSAVHLSWWLLICAAILLYALVVALLTEKQTDKVRQVLRLWLNRPLNA